MTAGAAGDLAPEERERAPEPYAGPPPMRRPTPEQLRPAPQQEPDDDVAVPEPVRPLPYLLAMRSAPWAWWRPVAGLAVVAFLLGIALVLTGIADVLTGTGADLGPAPLTWRGLLVTGLLLATAVPAVLLAWPLAHDVGPGRGLSVARRFRWGLLRRAALLALGTAGAGVTLATAGAVLLADREAPGPVADLPWVLVAGLLTVPLRAAGEEFLLRGYLSQAVAGWIGRPRAGAVTAAVVSAALGALLHGADDAPAFLGWTALGLAASAAVALTGGLEAAVALHAVVALVVFLLTAGLGDGVVPGLSAGPGTAFALVGAGGLAAFAALVARRGART
ncbi:CPBP family intramembrane metalloprotease [Blastococcus sp. TML/M2B]|uniref:CPBP family glutamic-type intramembrane protease n=1 Tax=unclassified Blastococcus TaxID=2619396 RepID=UPI00190AD8ED|nr:MULTISPECIES: CPBP family glutamic-type intramembrane protease [unclassified Blastococcus]MBN1093595.1 CPBP family intramembrane metalloprotease [Blastococcus sp. TML/M2B]MBN1096286.1 CPBP family intramembrane metalloprotease [Blastococcus sp. TML/C7B]